VAIRIPDVEVNVEPGRCAAQTYLYASDILIRIEFEVSHVRRVYTPDKLVVLLLLFADGF
jgi:hypothetical protein